MSELIIVGHSEEDIPKLPYYLKASTLIQPRKGYFQSLWNTIKNHSTGNWIIWVNDDNHIITDDWLTKANIYRFKYPDKKIFHFNSGIHMESVCIGMGNREYFLQCFPDPIYSHYAWDGYIKWISMEEDKYILCEDIIIGDKIDRSRINHKFMKEDTKIMKQMKSEYLKKRRGK
jgi:hypothetical protein